jgi:hypothetical protein
MRLNMVPGADWDYNVRPRNISLRRALTGYAMATTPFGYRLCSELENEFLRMTNEWFFKWHALGWGGAMVVDDFNGRQISYAGNAYSGSPHFVFWDAVRRYVSNKINSVFEGAENEIRAIGTEHVQAIADDTAAVLSAFCRRILDKAVETDHNLNGDGLQYVSSAAFSSFFPEIEHRKQVLVQFYIQPKQTDKSLPPKEMLALRPGFWGVNVDLKEVWRRGCQWWRSRP